MTLDRPSLRADAARNRERLLEAARRVFARQGPEAPLEDVAQAANVTRTTRYRHFPTRADLAAEVYADNVTQIERLAEELADRDDGIVAIVDGILDMQREDRSLASVMRVLDLERMLELSARTEAAIAPLLRRGREVGMVHPDIAVSDVMMVFPMIEGVIHDGEESGRGIPHDRARLMVHRALFTERGWELRKR